MALLKGNSNHPRPFDADFYERARSKISAAEPAEVVNLSDASGFAIAVSAGELLTIKVSRAQIVNLFMFNSHDPDERYWAHETALIEGVFLRRLGRLWGTMARFRPMATILEDTVTARADEHGRVGGKHHWAIGGNGTPADWRFAHGPRDAVTSWEQFTSAMSRMDLETDLLMDDVALFQKTVWDGFCQEYRIVSSDAQPGDSVTLFAELDLTVLLALSPYMDGSQMPSTIDQVTLSEIEVTRSRRIDDPLPWPYQETPYPDLSLYLTSDGTRSTVPGPTKGRELPS